jgi:hypothetical protein
MNSSRNQGFRASVSEEGLFGAGPAASNGSLIGPSLGRVRKDRGGRNALPASLFAMKKASAR